MPNFPNSNKVEAGDNEIQEETNENNQVSFHMSLHGNQAGSVTGRILLSFYTRKLSPVDRDEIQEIQSKWWNINMHRS